MGRYRALLKDAVIAAIALPLRVLVLMSRETDVVLYDVQRWVGCLQRPDLEGLSEWAAFSRLVMYYAEYRSLVHYRVRGVPTLLRFLGRTIYPGEKTLHLAAGRIGRGLFIQHGFATIVAAQSIGDDCWINQQVTIGFRGASSPVIGNRVRIGAAAVIVGGVVLGDDVRVGVNATVVRSVTAGETVVAPEAVTLASARALREPADGHFASVENQPLIGGQGG